MTGQGIFLFSTNLTPIVKNWYQRGSAADGNGERAVIIRRCPAAVKRRLCRRQSERPPGQHRRGSTLNFLPLAFRRPFQIAATSLTAVVLIASPAFAHHPFGMGDSSALTAWQGLISGIGHPLLGPDHLLFLLAIALIGLKRPLAWVVPLLALGLGGSVLSQFIPLPDAIAPWAEALVSLSLVAEGLIALTVLSPFWLCPLIALHGFLLGSTIVGAEATPLLTYFLGLLLGQGALLLLVAAWSKGLLERLGSQGQRLGAGIWMGIGMAFAWVALID